MYYSYTMCKDFTRSLVNQWVGDAIMNDEYDYSLDVLAEIVNYLDEYLNLGNDTLLRHFMRTSKFSNFYILYLTNVYYNVLEDK